MNGNSRDKIIAKISERVPFKQQTTVESRVKPWHLILQPGDEPGCG